MKTANELAGLLERMHIGVIDIEIAETLRRQAAEIDALRVDAIRYRWLRMQDWDTGKLAVSRRQRRSND